MIPEWAVNELCLREEVKNWIQDAIKRQRNVPWRGGHDEGTFASSWVGYYLLTGDRKCLNFLYWLRDSFIEWSKKNQYHGYYPIGETHHQTETYNNFLGHLWRAEKTDVNVAVLEDAAHHIGNWVKGIPKWYDWKNHRFRSRWFGTREVKDYPPFNYESCDHFRLIQMALNTYLATGDNRYLEISRDYADRWCKLILDNEELPTILYPTETWLKHATEICERSTDRLIRRAWRDIKSAQGNVWRYVGGGVIDTFLDLYYLTHEERYLKALKKIFCKVERAVHSPRIIAKYRYITGDTSYDEKILNEIKRCNEEPLPTIIMIEATGQYKKKGKLVFRRKFAYRDADGNIKEYEGPSSEKLLLGYQISGDEELLNRAMKLAKRKLSLARTCLRDGREHGCGGGIYLHGVGDEAVHILCSATLGLYKLCGGYQPKVLYYTRRKKSVFRYSEKLGLPEGVASLLKSASRNGMEILLYNGLQNDLDIKVKVMDRRVKIENVKVNGVSQEFNDDSVVVAAENQSVTEVKIDLTPEK